MTLSETGLGDVVAAWIRSLASMRDLIADAAAWLAPFTGRDPGDLVRRREAMTGHDFDWFWKDLSIPAGRADAAAVCRALLTEAWPASAPGSVANALLKAMSAGRAPNGVKAAASLAEIASSGPLPTLLLTPPGPADAAAWLAAAGRLLAGLVAAVPALAAAVTVEAADAEAVFRAGLPAHWLAVLREGWVAVESLGEAELAQRLQAAGVPAGQSSAARRLAEDGASEELAAAFAEAARRAGPKTSPEEEDAARSAAERFLFERLESLTATAGLFALNRRLDFFHGPAHAEVDLLAASLRLVVELDGSYYHLRDCAAYRRDRRKDWELQRRGYLVLRFLSDDVVERLEEILDTILAAVELRRTSRPERGGLA